MVIQANYGYSGAMFDPDDMPKPKAVVAVGADLSALSIADLQVRVADLKAEIARTEQEIVKKQSVSVAAAAFFKN